MKSIFTKPLLFFLLAFFASQASAYDFKVDGLCYRRIYNDDENVIVTYENSSDTRYSDLSGDVVIPPTVTYEGKVYNVSQIDGYAFSLCTRITSISIPKSIEFIGYYAFNGCVSLKSVIWNIKNYEYPDTKPFSGITSITNFSFGNNVESIPDKLCEGLIGLASVVLPNSIKYIGTNAFNGCKHLRSITFPNSLCTIRDKAFEGTQWLKDQPDGMVYAGLSLYKCKGSQQTNFEIREGTLAIAECAFQDCSVNSIVIPNSVKEIYADAFKNCYTLSSINIPKSVERIGQNAFNGCKDLESIIVSADNKQYDSRNNCNAIIETSTNTLISGCKNTVIPDAVTSIGEYAFAGCVSLESITIPKSVSEFGFYAFYNCTGLNKVNIYDLAKWCECQFNFGGNPLYYSKQLYLNNKLLTNLVIPSSVTKISTWAFYQCESIKSLTISSSVTTIGSEAFRNCIGISSLTIPSSVTSIGGSAFYGCSGLKELTWNAIECASAGGLYQTQNNITKVTIGPEVKIIPEYFIWNSQIKELVIPNSVTTISRGAFYRNKYLCDLTIGESVKLIQIDAFSDCFYYGNNKIIKCYAKDPPSTGKSSFNNVNISKIALHVPKGCDVEYFGASFWQDFDTITDDLDDSIKQGDVNADNIVDVKDVSLLVNRILNGENNISLDINGDNSVDVKDVTALINLILK